MSLSRSRKVLLTLACVQPPVAQRPGDTQPKNTPRPEPTGASSDLTSMPSGIFDENSEQAIEAWRVFTAEGRYRVARADDFKIPPAAMKEEGDSISQAIKFAYVGEDINRDALHRDRAFIVVDTTRSDPARFGLVIFNEPKEGPPIVVRGSEGSSCVCEKVSDKESGN